MGSGSGKPNVFEYDNYRSFVRDYYAFFNAQDKKFSHRYFSRLAGFKSSNFIKFIIDGKSNASDESALKLAKAMKLNRQETQFFKTLVQFNQAKESEQRHRLALDLISTRAYREVKPLNEALFNYLAKWYLSPLRGAVGLPGFKEDPDWLSERFAFTVSAEEIRAGLADLLQLGLIRREADGRLVQSNATVATADEVTASPAAVFHREMMKRASESIDLIAREKRDISGMTVGVSEETAKVIKGRIQEFRKELVDIVAKDTGVSDCVYQLNFQLFPVFAMKAGKGKG